MSTARSSCDIEHSSTSGQQREAWEYWTAPSSSQGSHRVNAKSPGKVSRIVTQLCLWVPLEGAISGEVSTETHLCYIGPGQKLWTSTLLPTLSGPACIS